MVPRAFQLKVFGFSVRLTASSTYSSTAASLSAPFFQCAMSSLPVTVLGNATPQESVDSWAEKILTIPYCSCAMHSGEVISQRSFRCSHK